MTSDTTWQRIAAICRRYRRNQPVMTIPCWPFCVCGCRFNEAVHGGDMWPGCRAHDCQYPVRDFSRLNPLLEQLPV
jgi:hypothetical protein